MRIAIFKTSENANVTGGLQSANSPRGKTRGVCRMDELDVLGDLKTFERLVAPDTPNHLVQPFQMGLPGHGHRRGNP